MNQITQTVVMLGHHDLTDAQSIADKQKNARAKRKTKRLVSCIVL